MTEPTGPQALNIPAGARRALFWEGLVLIVLGALAIALPVLFTLAVELLLGVLLLVGGAFRLFRCLSASDGSSRVWPVIASLLAIVAGIFLLTNPLAGTITLTSIVIILLLVEGAAKVAGGLTLRPSSGWGWMLFNGAIDILLGVLLWAGLPDTALWALGLMIGISLLMTGLSAMMMSSALKQLEAEN